MNKDLFHSLESNNIYFKPLSLNDIEDIHFYASDEDVKRFIGWSLMKDLSETKKHIETMMAREINGTHLYASVALKSNHKVINFIDGQYFNLLMFGKINP